MKKNFIFKEKKTKQKKLIRFMKYCLIFIILGIGSCFANETYSQRTFFTFEYKNRTVKEIIREIEQSSEYIFFYMDKSVNLNRKVSVKVDNEQVEKVLDQLFAGTRNQYYISDRQIIISSAKAPEPINIAPVIQQQGRTITGVVRDASGPVIGANVVIKGTTNGDVTNIDGRFSISNIQSNAVLQVSFIGYVPQEVSVGNQSSFDIIIQEDIGALEEVVVVGYGTLRKKDLTGSVGQVSSSVLESQVTRQIDQALTGQIAGVQVISKTGSPGQAPIIRIRGVGSITASSEPLYVVDGFPTDNIQTINPGDIESMDILKDASSTAIYGSRGSNGVIIINTKRGVAGKPTITLDVSHGYSKTYEIPPMMTGPELAEYAYWSVRQRNLDMGITNEVLDNTTPTEWPGLRLPTPQWEVVNGTNVVDFDMVRAILRTAPETRYMVGVNGGNDNVRYSMSAEYLSQEGVVLNSNFDRLSVRSNFDLKLSQRASIKLNLNPSFTNENMSYESSSSAYGTYISSSPVNRAQLWPSYFPARHPSGYTGYSGEDGEYFMFDHNDASHEWNPLAQVNEVLNNRKRDRILANLELDFQILNDLRLNIMLGGTITNSSSTRFEPSLMVFSSGGDYDNDAFGEESASKSINWATEYTLHYNKTFGKHSVQGLAGFTAQANWTKNASLQSNRYPNNLIPYLSAVANIITAGTATVNEWSMVSYLARLNYNYDSKYYLTATWRTDGSSRFGKDNKYGYFPSASLAWRISQEGFLTNIEALNDLKLRVSYGLSGNNNIGGYNHIATISYLRTVWGGAAVEGYAPARLDNSMLTWEVQKQINAGLDLSIFNNRLAVTFDFYRSRNTDLLLDVNIPATTGFTRTTKNIGEVENTGFDIQVKTENLRSRNFRWSTDFNISHFTNKVISLGPEGDPIISEAHITQIGRPIGMFYGYIKEGILMTQAEVDSSPLFGTGTPNQSRPGDFRWKDVNGDGVINSLDQTEMGNPYPDFTYGMTNNVSWKNLSLSVSLYGSYGNDVLNLACLGIMNRRGNRVNQLARELNYWISEQQPGDGKTPRPNDVSTGGGNREISQHYMDYGSFLRINNLRLQYDIPMGAIRNFFNANSLRAQIYFNITNLHTFTKNETCFNPDISNSTASATPGVSFSDYPLPRTYLLGININF